MKKQKQKRKQMKLKRWKITIFDSAIWRGKRERESEREKKKTLTPNSKSVQNSHRAKRKENFSHFIVSPIASISRFGGVALASEPQIWRVCDFITICIFKNVKRQQCWGIVIASPGWNMCYGWFPVLCMFRVMWGLLVAFFFFFPLTLALSISIWKERAFVS